MNLFEVFQSSFSVRLMLTLVHLLWQGFAIALLIGTIGACLKQQSAKLRYALSLLALIAVVVCVPTTYFVIGEQNSSNPKPSIESVPVNDTVASTIESKTSANNDLRAGYSQVNSSSSRSPIIESNNRELRSSFELPADGSKTQDMRAYLYDVLKIAAPYATVVYFLGVLLMLFRLFRSLCSGRNLRRLSIPVEDHSILDMVKRQANRLHLRAIPLIAFCESVSVPVVIGILKPMVLLPTSFATGLSPSHLESILAHELAHIRRYDMHINLFQRLVEATLFFHPAVWYISKKISAEREIACDDLVLSAGWRKLEYADALVQMAEACRGNGRSVEVNKSGLIAATGESPSEFKKRIMRLLELDKEPRIRFSKTSFFTSLLCLTALILIPVIVQSVANEDIVSVTEIPWDEQEKATISGRIILEDGSPIGMKKRQLFYQTTHIHPNGSRWTKSGNDIEFKANEFTHKVKPGTVWLKCFRNGYAPAWVEPFELKPGEKRNGIVIVLKPGLRKLVEVVNNKGTPVEGALVSALPEINGEAEGESVFRTTNNFGKCYFNNLADVRYELTISAPRYEKLRIKPVDLKKNAANTFSMTTALKTRGVVRDVLGKPLPNAKIYLKKEWHESTGGMTFGGQGNNPSWGIHIATTDRQGHFELNELSRGAEYLMIVEAEDQSRMIVRSLKANQKNAEIIIPKRHDIVVKVNGDLSQLQNKLGKVIVRVSCEFLMTRKKAPWSETSVLISGNFVVEETANGGLAIFRGLPIDPGANYKNQKVEVTLIGSKKLFDLEGDKKISVEIDSTNETIVEFNLPERKINSAKLSGTISSEDGTPSKVRGWLYAGTEKTKSSFISDTIGDFKGEFSANVPPGKTWLNFFPEEGFAPVRAGPFVLDAGDKNEDIKFVLKPGYSNLIRILDENGKPIKAATFHALPHTKSFQSWPIFEKKVNQKGEYLLKNLADVPYKITAKATGYQTIRTKPMELKPNQTTILKLKLSKKSASVIPESKKQKQHSEGKSIDSVGQNNLVKKTSNKSNTNLAKKHFVSGKIVDPDGNPIPKAMVFLGARDNYYIDYNRNAIPISNATGEFEIPDVSSGLHKVTFFSPDWGLKTVLFSAPMKEPLKVTLEKGKRLEIRTIDSQGKPIPGVRIDFEASVMDHLENRINDTYHHVLDFLCNRSVFKNKTDEAGVFVWENAPSGKLTYDFYGKDVLSIYDQEFGPEKLPHTVVFRRRIPVTLSVTDKKTGLPIPEFQVFEGDRFKANISSLWSWELERKKGENGNFNTEIRNFGELVRFRIQAKGYRPIVSRVLDAKKLPSQPIILKIQLEKNQALKGKVLQPNGKLASNAVIYLKERKSKPNYSSHLRVVSGIVLGHENLQTIKCDAIGKFDIPKMDDVYACYISHSSGYAKLMDAEIYDGEAIKLIPWSKVEGQVLHYGKPAAGVVVSLKNLTGIGWEESRFPYISFSETQLTDGNGKYQFKKCFAGIWDQDFLVPAPENKSNDGYSVSKQISLVAGKTQIQNLGSSQSQLKGRVLFPDSFKPNLERSSVILSYHETICYTDDESDSPSSSCRPLSTQYISKLQKDGSFHVVDLGAEPRYLHIYVTDQQGIYDRSYKRYSLTKKITHEMLSKVKEGQALDLGELKLTRDLNFR